MVAFFTAGTLAIALPGFKSPMPVLYLLIFIAGATAIDTQILLCANTAQFYPLAMRSTGSGWASGVGRTGAIVGPLLGGSLLAAALPPANELPGVRNPWPGRRVGHGLLYSVQPPQRYPSGGTCCKPCEPTSANGRLWLSAKYSAPMHEIPSAPGAGDFWRLPPPKKLEKP